jgi:hypothetical protein
MKRESLRREENNSTAKVRNKKRKESEGEKRIKVKTK